MLRFRDGLNHLPGFAPVHTAQHHARKSAIHAEIGDHQLRNQLQRQGPPHALREQVLDAVRGHFVDGGVAAGIAPALAFQERQIGSTNRHVNVFAHRLDLRLERRERGRGRQVDHLDFVVLVGHGVAAGPQCLHGLLEHLPPVRAGYLTVHVRRAECFKCDVPELISILNQTRRPVCGPQVGLPERVVVQVAMTE